MGWCLVLCDAERLTNGYPNRPEAERRLRDSMRRYGLWSEEHKATPRSVVFEVEKFDTRVATVLGHSNCGAVQATIDELQGRTIHESGNLRSIIDQVRSAIDPLLAGNPQLAPDELLRQADEVRAAAKPQARDEVLTDEQRKIWTSMLGKPATAKETKLYEQR